MSGNPQPYQTRRIFVISAMALFTAGLSFSLRAAIMGQVEADLLVAIDPSSSSTLAGRLLGTAFLGFAVTLGVGSALLEWIGMGRMLVLGALCFAVGTGAVSLADRWVADAYVYDSLRLGYLLSGLGWGFVEASINPLMAALYPNDKTARLNILHAWWPAGLIVGGLAGLAVGAFGLDWRLQFSVVVPPAVLTAVLCWSTHFPHTARASAGISMAEMFGELFRRPMFVVWWVCMFLTAASELAPGQWIDLTLTRTVGMRGIWLLIYISGMMFVLRHFAGPIAHRISNLGMLWGSSVLAALGLLALSAANSPLTGLLAATVWGLGVCFMWPTMLANISERYPRGGELFIGLMGVAGALAIHFVLPALGAVFDRTKVELAGGEAAFSSLEGPALESVLSAASATSFQVLAWLPAVLIGIFGLIALAERRRTVSGSGTA
ncbi:MFS transporter [Myxococcota bacterium]|nr:MFS transporter [Myxococcota bacterium]